MSAAQIQSIINRGNGIAANIIGVSCNWYRPTATVFINETTLQGTINAYFDPKPTLEAKVPSSFAHPEWFAAVDRTNLQVGDYLVDLSGNTYFVNCLEPFTPTGVILCNAVANLFRPGGDNGPAADFYSGNVSGEGSPLLTNVPCSILQGTKGEADGSGVVASPRIPWAAICLPNISGVVLNEADLLIDNQNRRYLLSSIETSILGIRATAQYSNT